MLSAPSPMLPDTGPVLVVDDEAGVRHVLVRLLQAGGYQVMDAAGTDAALETLGRHGPFALVISDVQMPGRDGLELLHAVRREYPDTAVLMLTGDANVAKAVECLKAGALDYLTKPIVGDELRARVGRVMTQRRDAIELRRLQEAYRTDLERQVRELSRKNRDMFLAQVQMAVRMLEARDQYTRGHSQRVAEYAVATATAMNLDPVLVAEIRLGAELHDIGKIGVRDAVLHKTGPLTDEEFVEMRRHTIDGEEMLELLRDEHPELLRIVRWHHERLDGSGFPDGLAADDIPLTARIVAVADAFDAMTTDRTYRSEQPIEYALAEVERCSGGQFDPAVVAAFRKSLVTSRES